MRALGLLVLAAISGRAEADPLAGPRVADEVMDRFEARSPRPMQRSCNGPATWAQIVSCTKAVEPSARIETQPSPHTQLIATSGSPFKKLYLQRADQKWVLVLGLDLQTHDLSERSVTVGTHRVLRVDLRIQQRNAVEIGDLLRTKTVYTCGVPNAEVCTSAVTTCAYYQHGRARSTFLGEASVTEAGLVVTGDRTRAQPFCDR